MTSYELENRETSRLQNVLLLYMRSFAMLCILHSLLTDLVISQKVEGSIAFKYKGIFDNNINLIYDVSIFVYEHT